MSKPRRKKIIVHPLVPYMEEHGLSQKALGDSLGVSQGLVWQWITGRCGITSEKAREIEKLTGIPRLTLLYPDERGVA